VNATQDRVPDCERWDRAGGYCIEGKDCTCHASSNRVQRAGMCGPDCPEEPDGCEWGKCPYCEGADAIPNRVPDACGDDECEDMCGPVDASGNYTRCRATRNRGAWPIIEDALREKCPEMKLPGVMAWYIVKRLREEGIIE